jgi:hypothetical protein
MSIRMTTGTIDRFMSAARGKFCFIMIKTFAPGDGRCTMAIFALRAESFHPVINRRCTFKIPAMA